MITMITKVMPGWAHRWLVGGKELVMVLHLECHVLQDLDEQLCRKLDKSQLPVCTSTTTRASCLVEEIVRKYFTNFLASKNVLITLDCIHAADVASW